MTVRKKGWLLAISTATAAGIIGWLLRDPDPRDESELCSNYLPPAPKKSAAA